jgi:magnesium-transporting ATPase (P-type)
VAGGVIGETSRETALRAEKTLTICQPTVYEVSIMTTPPNETAPTESQNTDVTESKKSEETAPERLFKFTLSEGILIALVTVGAYLVTYAYELGYTGHFGISEEFINLNLTNLLVTASLLTVFVTLSIPLIEPIVPRIRSWLVSPSPGRPLILVALMCYGLFFLLAMKFGELRASGQVPFLVTTSSSSQEMVLLRAYGDVLIFAPFNRKTREVQKSFTIIKIGDLKTALTLEDVGDLTPVLVKPSAASSSPPGSTTPTPSAAPSK